MQDMKIDLGLKIPLMNASGILGFAPEANNRINFARLGAFITHPVSLLPRMPAHGTRFGAYHGGFLLHTGYPNPGLRAVTRRYQDAWQRSPLPVWVHLLGDEPEDVKKMVLFLEELPGVVGFELGIPPEIDARLARSLVQAALGELPLIVSIPLERVIDLAEMIGKQFPQVILSLGPPRGKLPCSDKSMVAGRLYGPAIFPQALLVLERVLSLDIPVIAAGGVYSVEQARLMLKAGAVAVQLDAVLWRNGLQNWILE
ncbi:MAG TPA: hypothetical protein VLM80_00425 [Anaerolineales bacterium]|nr:hypothetical protein [Anaerolineales bacterium]